MVARNRFASRSVALLFGAAAWVGVLQCGGGDSLNRSKGESGSSSFDVVVSAGGPVSGATVTVYAIADGNGQVNALAGSLGVIGAGGPTDESGKATIKLSGSYSGPIQVVASGASLSYPDPTIATVQGRPAPVIQIPSTFVLSSLIPQYKTGTSVVVPVTLLTTLADHEALAYVRGAHPLHPGGKTLGETLAARDPLWVAHFTNSANAWNASKLRSTVPASFTTSTTTLVDTGYAALFDLALNQLARDTAVRAGYGSGPSAMTAITLAQLLEEDLDADAVLNGKGSAGAAIVTQGTTPVALDSQFLRKPLAQALDTWIQNVGLNLSGIHQADLIGAQVLSAMSTDASDLFGDPPNGSYDPVDRMPPVVALVTEPALSTAAAKISLTMTASDPSGVAGVYARVAGTRSAATQQADGTWQVSLTLPVVGHNIIAIWAEDQSPSGNSGLDGQPPYQLTRDILFDTTSPSAQYDQNFASYYDERDMQVSAQVPPTYTTGPKVAVPLGGEFWKVATRLSAGTATAADLETTNPQNIPLLRFAVPYNAQTDSPITQATYKVSVSCPSPCPAFPDATGALVASPTKTDQQVNFTLPLALEYVPALARVQGPAQMSVTIALVDAAGNKSTESSPWSFKFHVLGPPLVVSEDSNYAAANDGKSTFPYRMSQASYATLYSSAATVFNPENTVRLVRYVITNPASQAVALSPAFDSGAWNDSETWTAIVASNASSVYEATQACGAIADPTASPPGPGNVPVQVDSCAGNDLIFFPADGSAHQCGTDPGASTVAGVQASASLSAAAYNRSNGEDSGGAAMTGSGRYVVPGASGTAPGVLSLYVVRPRSGLQSRIALDGWDGSGYSQEIGREARKTTTYRQACFYGGSTCRPGGWCDGRVDISLYAVDRYYRRLTSAADNLAGTLYVQTLGLGEGGAEFGEVRTIPGGALDLARTISH